MRISPFITAFGSVLAFSGLLSELARGQAATVVEISNVVQSSVGSNGVWNKAALNQSLAVGDRIRTRRNSLAAVALKGLYTFRLDQDTTVGITPGLESAIKAKLDLIGGATFIFSREKNGEMDVKMPAANAALRGTQLYAQVLPNGKSLVQVLEGSVELENPQGKLLLAAGEAGEALPGQAPRRTAVIDAKNILQWALYYPAVLEMADLKLGAAESGRVARSLGLYQKGNLLDALETYPAGAPQETGGRLFRAGVLLAVGRLDEARPLLAGVPRDHPGRRAIERMIAAVKLEPAAEWRLETLRTASEAMAESYYLQAFGKLEPARLAALRATELAPENGYAWTRLAELEFSAGKNKAARAAIEKGLKLTPQNARAHALRGFILSGDNRIDEARLEFQESIRLDGGFGNGWLGLGLTKIKQGDLAGGRADLQIAATVEPTSSIFHSYLGKALSQEGRTEQSDKDLKLARILDPNDPTPLLYSAIEKQQQNRTNAAIADLEKSIELNDNRRIYRSAFLLDQDRAVRNANLARIYQNAGMDAVAVREATRAVESDYGNASAHLFLANSFDALRDPDRILLRYETPWFNELLISKLLSPVGGGPLSQIVSQQEYSKLLEADGVGGSTTTEWRSNSELRTTASAFGTHGNVSYGLDAYYRNDDGDRPNSDMEIQEIYGQMKWQATPDDIFYFLGKWATQSSGDIAPNYDNKSEAPGLDFNEDQEPGLLLAGWNHRWAPGSNTLFLGGFLSAEQTVSNPDSRQLLVQRDTSGMFGQGGFLRLNLFGRDEFADRGLRDAANSPRKTDRPFYKRPDGTVVYSPELLREIAPFVGSGNLIPNGSAAGSPAPFDFETRRKFDILTGEIQHIHQSDNNTLLLGGRWQQGRIETDARMESNDPIFGGFPNPAVDQHQESDYQRIGIYAYDYWNITPNLTLIGGMSWDSIDHPANFRNPPLDDTQVKDEAFSGKFGFNYQPAEWVTLRGVAARSMGGLSYDESVRLEPAQLAGFNQAYRTALSESLAGSVEAPVYQIYGLSAEGSLPTRTWWGASVEMIQQDVKRMRGIYTGYTSSPAFQGGPVYFPDGTRENLDYNEQSLNLTLSQLVGDEFAVGAGYRVTRSELQTTLPELRPYDGSSVKDQATLQQLSLYADWNSPTGFFAHVEVNGYRQDLEDDPQNNTSRNGDEFAQVNAWAGYRFNRNLCEISAGVLNIGDTDYQLSPLNPYSDIARERTFFVLCRLSF